MSDKRKILIIILIVFAFYWIYYSQDAISAFIKDPIGTIKKDAPLTKVLNEVNPTDKVRIQVVGEEDAVIKVVEDASPAVVSIVSKGVYSESSIGTGFIVDGTNGIILTNKHVVDDTSLSYSAIIGEAQESYDINTVYRDPVNDFAILKFTTNGKTLPQVELGDSDIVKVGQSVVAIGNALGQFGNSVTKGVISGIGRGIMARSGPFGSVESLDNVFQTDAALNPGNSGGPLINLQGKVIGINVAISQGAQNIGFSIPINTLKPILTSFQQNGKISRPFLGVEYVQITKDVGESRSLPVGAFIQSIVKGSPAEKSGIKVADIILSINGTRIDEKDNTLARVVSKQEVDKAIDLVLDRNGKEITLTVKLQEYEEN